MKLFDLHCDTLTEIYRRNENMLENSKAKLEKKNLDMIVANNLKVKGAGFGTDTNIVTIITKDEVKELPIMSKDEVANALLNEIVKKQK